MVDLVGLLASAMSFVLFLPAAKKVWENRNDPHALQGVSMGTNMLVVLNALLWALYGFLTHAFWVAAPGIVNLPLALFSIHLIARGRRRVVTAADDEQDGARVFITAPPGFGSVMTASAATVPHGIRFHTDEELQMIREQNPRD